MDVPGISRPVLVLLIVVAAFLFAFGATKAADLLTQHTDTHTRVLAAAPTIVVDVETGDVRIAATDRRDVRLTTKEKRSMWGGGHVEVAGDGARLHLGDHCSKVPLVDATCSVSYVLEVPRHTDVRLVAGTGDLHIESLEGNADLRSGTGDLHVVGVTGTVRVQADTGDIHVEGASPDISARTDTGDIDVEASNPTTIAAQSDTGDIDYVVPAQAYAVDVHADTGDETVDVDRDDTSPRRLRARTGTGDIVVSGGLPVS
jgi:hypothetical protein